MLIFAPHKKNKNEVYCITSSSSSFYLPAGELTMLCLILKDILTNIINARLIQVGIFFTHDGSGGLKILNHG